VATGDCGGSTFPFKVGRSTLARNARSASIFPFPEDSSGDDESDDSEPSFPSFLFGMRIVGDKASHLSISARQNETDVVINYNYKNLIIIKNNTTRKLIKIKNIKYIIKK
jgi:hypothetical protein